MRLTRRDMAKLGLGAAALRFGLGPFEVAQAQSGASVLGTGIRSHGHSLLGALRYPADFKHPSFVNPDAPKGGAVRMSEAFNGFDNFNRYISAGTPSIASIFALEALMTSSLEEGSAHYGLLAEWMETGPDNKWVAFRLRDEARFHDGEPVRSEDVLWSFETLRTKGSPFWASYWANVTAASDIGDRTVLFEFDQAGNKELPHIVGQLTVLPAHWWEGRDFAAPILEPLLGSGPYRFGDFAPGQHVEMERVEDYWGAELPINIGSNNFDRIRIESFGDDTVEFEAFKSGDLDYRQETTARRWALDYEFPAIKSGDVKKEEVALEGPQGVSGFFYNLRREKFQHRKVREALNLLLDFENLNKTVYYDQYARPTSYFQGTADLMAVGVPEGEELALLEPFRAQLPAELFERPFEHVKTDGSGRLSRRILRRARALFAEAGWSVEGGKMRDASGQPVRIEFLTNNKAFEPTIRPYAANIELMGIDTEMRIVDRTQFATRRREFDYDCLLWGLANSESPGNEQRDFWSSEEVEKVGGRNFSGVANPVVDALIDKIIFADGRPALAAASRALDRVLLFEYYITLRAYSPFERIAFWKDRVAHPEPLPSRRIGFPTVWWSKEAEQG